MEEKEWDYSSEYCDGCAELGMTTCSCEDERVYCSRCGAEMYYDEDICGDCLEEEETN